jgi:hypothetical protein
MRLHRSSALLRDSPLASPKRGRRRRRIVSRCFRNQRSLLVAAAATLVLVVVLYFQMSVQVASAGAKRAASRGPPESSKQAPDAEGDLQHHPDVQAKPASETGSRNSKNSAVTTGNSSFSHFKRGHSPKRALNGACLNCQILLVGVFTASWNIAWTQALIAADIEPCSMFVNLSHCSFSAERHCTRHPCSATQQR